MLMLPYYLHSHLTLFKFDLKIFTIGKGKVHIITGIISYKCTFLGFSYKIKHRV